MKRTLLKRITAAASAFAVAVTVTAAPRIKGGWLFGSAVRAEESDVLVIPVEVYEYSDNDDGVSVTITKYSGGSEDVRIPAEIDGKRVTKIGDKAFESSINLKSVTIPKGVSSIGDYAFQWCFALTNITIPDSVTSIGEGAFIFCDELTSITIPNSVTSIGKAAFYECGSLKSLTLSNNITSIGEETFYACSSLESLTIPDSVTSIEEGAFVYCTGLTGVTLPNSITSIGKKAFWGCSSLKSLTIPDSVTHIGISAFSDCISLTSIILPNGITSIEFHAFSGCTSLTSIILPNGITSIEFHAFSGCTSLKSIIIPNSVTHIYDAAFKDCTSLTSITLPNSIDIDDINEYAFDGCKNLTAIKVSEGNERYTSVDGILYTKDMSQLVMCPQGKEGKLIIPDSVTTIGYFSFLDCSGLTEIKIPNSVTEIEYGAFKKCDNLTLYGYDNSCAREYSNENDIPFKFACEFYSPAVHDIEVENTDESGTYWICKACGKHFSDENGTIEITLETSASPAVDSSVIADSAKEYSERGAARAINAARSGSEIRIDAKNGSPITEDNAKALAAKKNVTATFEYCGYSLSVNSNDMNSDQAGNLDFSSKTRFLTKAETESFSKSAEVRQFALKTSSFNSISKGTLTVTMRGGSKGKTAKLLLRIAGGRYTLIDKETVGSNRQVSFNITKPGNYIVYTGEADIEYEEMK